MRIEEFTSKTCDGRSRVSATVIWEGSERPNQEIYFETEAEFGHSLWCHPDAFLIASVFPAAREREKRVLLKEPVCPELRAGLVTIMNLYRHWYGPDYKPVQIEGPSRISPISAPEPRRAASFLTGGIDSLATLRANRLSFPLEHPGSIKEAILVFGLEVENEEAFEFAKSAVSKVAQAAGVTLIPVYTNIRSLLDDWVFWYSEYMGAALSAVAHALSRRLSVAYIASDYDIPNIAPHGSHPLVEPNCSSFELRVRYDGITLSRFGKIKLIADWDEALQNIRVCNRFEYYRPDRLNCGECEKCIRTMLGLVAAGALKRSRAFPHTDVSEELLSRASFGDKVFPFYQELISPLEEIGRLDLARTIRRRRAQFKRAQALNWREPLTRFDQTYLRGSLGRLKRLAAGIPAALGWSS